MKKMTTIKSFFIVVMLCLMRSVGAQYSWSFETSAEGWVLSNNLTGFVSAGVYNLNITGADPYMHSPTNLTIDAAVYGLIRIRMQNMTSDTGFQVFWITQTDGNWNQTKSVTFTAKKNDTQISEYLISLNDIGSWSGVIKQLRFDTGNAATSGTVLLDLFAVEARLEDFELKNDYLHLKQDLSRGGSISFIAKAGTTRNIVNIHDEGRYIQQSYYAGNSLNRQSEGQSPSWSPWPWNPIQGGDYARNRAPILVSEKTANSLYVKCTPMLWDMNNKPAEATMEQWTTMDGNVIRVKNKFTSFRTDNIYGENILRDQEIPAVYPISALKNLYSYFGSSPWTNAPMDNPSVVYLSSGFWGRYHVVTEQWMAFVDDALCGIGVYSPTATKFLAGMSGSAGGEATSASTSYISPVRQERLMKNSVMEYEYFLVVGTLSEIRSKIYQIQSSLTAVPQTQEASLKIYPNPVDKELIVDIPYAARARIYDMQSRLVKEFNLQPDQNRIDVGGIAQGVYVLKCENGVSRATSGFVKL
jgi:hypothetical protein